MDYGERLSKGAGSADWNWSWRAIDAQTSLAASHIETVIKTLRGYTYVHQALHSF